MIVVQWIKITLSCISIKKVNGLHYVLCHDIAIHLAVQQVTRFTFSINLGLASINYCLYDLLYILGPNVLLTNS